MNVDQSGGYLREFVVYHAERMRVAQGHMPLASLQARVRDVSPPRGFLNGLREGHARKGFAIIGELKRASPSKGLMKKDLDVTGWAREYQRMGLDAISVLTEERRFRGSLKDLEEAKAGSQLPVLRKDFILDPYQVWEARAAGADAILVIVRILAPDRLRELAALATQLGMDVLLEIHDAHDAAVLRGMSAPLVGINHRDLTTFDVDLHACERLMPLLPAGACVVAESGLSTPDQIKRLALHGVHGALIGEAFLRLSDPSDLARAMFHAVSRRDQQSAIGS